MNNSPNCSILLGQAAAKSVQTNTCNKRQQFTWSSYPYLHGYPLFASAYFSDAEFPAIVYMNDKETESWSHDKLFYTYCGAYIWSYVRLGFRKEKDHRMRSIWWLIEHAAFIILQPSGNPLGTPTMVLMQPRKQTKSQKKEQTSKLAVACILYND